jgi:hypothetical protein
MRYIFILVCTIFLSVTSAFAQLSVGIGLPGLNIGINVPLYPDLVPVPGYPVYYAPGMNSNYFFYDGMYWVYQGDNWYASSWYNGPWALVDPESVPLFVLRIPVRYYREPPAYFRGWQADAPPQWGAHWGNDWQQHHTGWDKWNHASVPQAAPLPLYQKQYSGNKYPALAQQQALHSQNYHYQPKDAVVKQHYQAQSAQPAPARAEQQKAPQPSTSRQQEPQRSKAEQPVQQKAPAAPREQAPPQTRENAQRPATPQAPPKEARPAVEQQSRQPPKEAAPREQQNQRPQSQPAPAQHEQQAPRPSAEKPQPAKSAPQEKGEPRGEEHK